MALFDPKSIWTEYGKRQAMGWLPPVMMAGGGMLDTLTDSIMGVYDPVTGQIAYTGDEWNKRRRALVQPRISKPTNIGGTWVYWDDPTWQIQGLGEGTMAVDKRTGRGYLIGEGHQDLSSALKEGSFGSLLEQSPNMLDLFTGTAAKGTAPDTAFSNSFGILSGSRRKRYPLIDVPEMQAEGAVDVAGAGGAEGGLIFDEDTEEWVPPAEWERRKIARGVRQQEAAVSTSPSPAAAPPARATDYQGNPLPYTADELAAFQEQETGRPGSTGLDVGDVEAQRRYQAALDALNQAQAEPQGTASDALREYNRLRIKKLTGIDTGKPDRSDFVTRPIGGLVGSVLEDLQRGAGDVGGLIGKYAGQSRFTGVGEETGQNVGRAIGEMVVPRSPLDIALTAAPFAPGAARLGRAAIGRYAEALTEPEISRAIVSANPFLRAMPEETVAARMPKKPAPRASGEASSSLPSEPIPAGAGTRPPTEPSDLERQLQASLDALAAGKKPSIDTATREGMQQSLGTLSDSQIRQAAEDAGVKAIETPKLQRLSRTQTINRILDSSFPQGQARRDLYDAGAFTPGASSPLPARTPSFDIDALKSQLRADLQRQGVSGGGGRIPPRPPTTFEGVPSQPLPPEQPGLGAGERQASLGTAEPVSGPYTTPTSRFRLAQERLRGQKPFKPPAENPNAAPLVPREQIAPTTLQPAVEVPGGRTEPPKFSAPPPKDWSAWQPPPEPAARAANPLKRALDEILGVVGLARTSAAAIDIGSIFRQMQGLGWGNKKVWIESAAETAKAFASDPAAKAAMGAVEADPFYGLMKKAGIQFFDWGPDAINRHPAWTGLRTESAISRKFNSLVGVQNGERAYAVGLNVQGAKVARPLFEALWNSGVRDLKPYEGIARVVNHGRGVGTGSLVRKLAGTDAFFSASNLIAIPQRILDPFTAPGALIQRGGRFGVEFAPTARALAAKNLASYMTGQVALLGMLGVTGAETGLWSVNPDPRSSDFGKVRIGSHTIDVTGGLAPLIRMVARAATGETVTRSGTFPTDWQTELSRFMRNKESPWASTMTDLLVGKNWRGQDVKITPAWGANRLASMYAPFLSQDVVNAFQVQNGSITEKAGAAVGAGLASAVGFGVQSYPPTASQQLRQDFSKIAGQDYDELLSHERDPIIATNPQLAAQAKKAEEARTGAAADIGRAKLAGLDAVAQKYAPDGKVVDPDRYRAAVGDVVANAAIEYERAKKDGEIPDFGDPKEAAWKALDGYYNEIGKARDPKTREVDYELQDKLGADYLAGLEPEMRKRILDELTYSKDPTYRQYLEARQRLTPYFNARDDAFDLARQIAQTKAANDPARLILKFESYENMRQELRQIFKPNTPETEIQGKIDRVVDGLGLGDYVRKVQELRIAKDPGMVLDLEKWYGAPQWLREFVATYLTKVGAGR